VRIFEHSRVTELHDGAPVVATVEERFHVRAGAAVLATHVPLNRVLLQGRLRHLQSYVVAFRDRNGIEDALFWDSASPYHYFRRATVAGKSYVLVGGEDHASGTEEHTEIAFERLLAYCRARLGTDRPDYHWSAQLHESIDGLPFIGRNAACRHVYIATGFAGNGMTFGTLGGLITGDLILGVANPWADLYAPGRLRAATIGKTLTAAGEQSVHLISDRLAAPEAKSTRDIERDQGRTLKVAGKRLAVYRDGQGALHALSGTCTHMGCLVHFNDAERTWDCPCHGSRYNVDGEVLEGPAVTALARYHLEDEAPPPQPEAADESPAFAPDPNPGLDGFK
jgi:Rieske Fe-S protein